MAHIGSSWKKPIWLVLPLALLLTPPAAQATLLVRSDGAGLFIEDKDGLTDVVTAFDSVLEGRSAYGIRTQSTRAPFEFSTGCREVSGFFGPEARCFRNGSQIVATLNFGDDRLDMHLINSADTNVVGRQGNDRLIGQGGPDELRGDNGDDFLEGRGGRDFLVGGPQSDRLEGGDGDDSLRGDSLNDALFGGLGKDFLVGDGGDPIVPGGSDFIDSKEPTGFPSEADVVICGDALDSVEADLADEPNIRADCEQREISPVGETPHVRVSRRAIDVNPAGVARVRLSCPRRTSIGCRGTLSLKLARRGARRPKRTRYAIRAGRSRAVRVRLTRGEARRLTRRTRGVLTSLERGVIGPKTTVRQPRLR